MLFTLIRYIIWYFLQYSSPVHLDLCFCLCFFHRLITDSIHLISGVTGEVPRTHENPPSAEDLLCDCCILFRLIVISFTRHAGYCCWRKTWTWQLVCRWYQRRYKRSNIAHTKYLDPFCNHMNSIFHVLNIGLVWIMGVFVYFQLFVNFLQLEGSPRNWKWLLFQVQ